MRRIVILTAAVVLVVASAAAAFTDNRFRRIREFLSGHREVPVISTTGRGTFTATINREGTEIKYDLKYSDLEATVTQAHIHVGPPQNTGGISVWLCSNLVPPAPPAVPPTPPGTQACPAEGGEIEGTITADDVVGLTYVNIHSSRFPAGEIRSQIGVDDHSGHDR
jgi:hypothetical protein